MKAPGNWLFGVLLLLSGMILSAHAQPSLSGDWSFSLSVDPADPSPCTWESTLGLTYSAGDWSVSSSTSLGEIGWTGQEFEAAGMFGRFSLESSLRFDPGNAAFEEWASSVSREFETVSLESTFTIAPNYLSLAMTADGEAGDVSFDIEIEFRSRGDCALPFNDLRAAIGFPFGCAEVASEFSVSCDGFEDVVFEVSDVPIANLTWITLDLELAFELDAKTVKLSPSLGFGDSACLELYVDVETSETVTLDGLIVYGIGLSCEVGAVSFEALTYVGGEHTLRGKYWEMYALSFNEEGCCGPVSGELAVYFLEGGIGLFDVGLFESVFAIALTERMTFGAGLTWNVEVAAPEELTFGFEVSW